MKELVKINDPNGKFPISARELHRVLKSNTRFNDWFEYRKNQYDLIKNFDYHIFTEISVKLQRGRPTSDYMLTIECAKELAMIENNEHGKKVRRYFIEIESSYKKLLEPVNGINPIVHGNLSGFPRRSILIEAGYSPNSGNVSRLKKQNQDQFFQILRVACITREMAIRIMNNGNARQLKLNFLYNDKKELKGV